MGQFALLPGCQGVAQDIPTASSSGPAYMGLDGAALQNLEVGHDSNSSGELLYFCDMLSILIETHDIAFPEVEH